MPDPLSSWLESVKSRLAGTKPETWIRESHHWGKENAAFIASAPSDLARCVRMLEAVERLANDWERTFPRNEPSKELRAALRQGFEAEK